jgi:hypothetical protein
VKALHEQLALLPDDRKGKNTQYAIKDAALGALAVFFTQSPSFLAYQRTMQQTKGRSNAQSLFGMVDNPCDNQRLSGNFRSPLSICQAAFLR